jgi:hypothetical protein
MLRYRDTLVAESSDLGKAILAGEHDKARSIYHECDAEFRSHFPSFKRYPDADYEQARKQTEAALRADAPDGDARANQG